MFHRTNNWFTKPSRDKRLKGNQRVPTVFNEPSVLSPPTLQNERAGWGGDSGGSVQSSGARSVMSLSAISSDLTYPEKNVAVSHHSQRLLSYRSSQTASSGDSRSTTMSQTLSRSRRERTYVGSECSVCEEPLEHTLCGERILQFSCSHVSHEACFYEFIREYESQYCPTCNSPLHLDTNRGGNVLDIEKITNLLKYVSANESRSTIMATPTPAWDDRPARPPSTDSHQQFDSGMGARGSGMISSHQNSSTSASDNSSRGRYRERDQSTERYTSLNSRHARSDSEATGIESSGDYSEAAQFGCIKRVHDYDVTTMETSLASSRTVARNPIIAPTVTLRSEFPTINRSRQQQTLTCLVTIEVPDNKWRPYPEDLQMGSVDGTIGANETICVKGMSSAAVSNDTSAASAINDAHGEDGFIRATSPVRVPRFHPYESPDVLQEMTENLRSRVDNWHGLDFGRFGKLRLYGTLRVGKDKVSWQELECYLFAEMLICVKEKKIATHMTPLPPQPWEDTLGPSLRKATRCTLKGSILINKHLNEASETGSIDENILTLSLSVSELPQFHLRFDNRNQLKLWQQALLDLHAVDVSSVLSPVYDRSELSETDEDDWQQRTPGSSRPGQVSSAASSWGGNKSTTTAATEYTTYTKSPPMSSLATSVHVPIDVVVVVPISSSMQGVKINLVKDALRFMVHTLGERDRMGLVTFGSGGGGVPVVGMTTKAWPGWSDVLSSIKPVGQKSHRADVVEGANVAMDLLMQRRYNNSIASIMLISDASMADADSVDFVVSRAEAAKITIHSFGLGMTHKPDTMIELSTRTKASYTYVKDWMMLRECLAGCLGAMQTLSHQNVKLKLKLPEGSPAKFHKISGALQITKRATGRDAEASLGDLHFGDKRDILVQLVILPDNASQEHLPQDAWETIVSGLEALGGPVDQDEPRVISVEEMPLIQADLSWGDILRDGSVVQMPRPSLLAITMLPPTQQHKSRSWQNTPAIPPHPSIVQRRMELLTSDMLTRALTLVSRGQHERAYTLLSETRSILKGLGKGGLPPVPSIQGSSKQSTPSTSHQGGDTSPQSSSPDQKPSPSPPASATSTIIAGFPLSNIILTRQQSADGLGPAADIASGIDSKMVEALNAELETSLEWINHPAVFGRDSRKAVLQAIGVISSQRAFTFRTPIEALLASRVAGVKRLTERSREWREEGGGEGGIMEEA